jgi:hypothetical protein
MHDLHKAQVFISYTTDDRPLVENFVKLLSDEAISDAALLWYDRKLVPSRDWDAEIMERLQNADIVLVLASPKYFESSYSIGREVPVIRGRVDGISLQPEAPFKRPLPRSAVRVIRLRSFDASKAEIQGFPSWPDGHKTVETVPSNGSEFTKLRTWLKVEICKALVARYSDRYHGRSREEWIREQEVFLTRGKTI